MGRGRRLSRVLAVRVAGWRRERGPADRRLKRDPRYGAEIGCLDNREPCRPSPLRGPATTTGRSRPQACQASGLPASGTQRGRRVQCRLFGQWLSEVGTRHLRRAHRITLAEYRRAVQEKRAAEADGVLRDRTPFFDQPGELADDADEYKIRCHLCGDWFKWVGGMHLKYRHPDWRIAEYRRAFDSTNRR